MKLLDYPVAEWKSGTFIPQLIFQFKDSTSKSQIAHQAPVGFYTGITQNGDEIFLKFFFLTFDWMLTFLSMTF